MKYQRRPIEPGDILNANARRKGHIESVSRRLIEYYADEEKKQRRASGLCRYCYYFDTQRIGGSAITTTNCIGCNKEITFGSTCTDELCLECALEKKLCKHCNGKLD
jgi:hypothetical protein